MAVLEVQCSSHLVGRSFSEDTGILVKEVLLQIELYKHARLSHARYLQC